MIINTPAYYAQVQTGNANAQSSVQTDIQGGGNVSTHIEVQANGEKKTLDANSPGTYSLSVQSNNNNNTNNPTVTPATPTPHLSSIPIASKEPELKPKITKMVEAKLLFFSNFIKDIENFFKKIFSFSR
jgi:hypothetical protein